MSAATEALYVFEAQQEKLDAKNKLAFSIFAQPTDDTSPQGVLGPMGMERTKLTAALRNANLAVVAEQQVAVPRWDAVVSDIAAKAQAQEVIRAQLVAKSAAGQTVAVASLCVGAIALLVFLEFI
ncbi:MAG TPA: hypothetical protein VIO16_05455 [Dehalococcoidia bacterium]